MAKSVVERRLTLATFTIVPLLSVFRSGAARMPLMCRRRQCAAQRSIRATIGAPDFDRVWANFGRIDQIQVGLGATFWPSSTKLGPMPVKLGRHRPINQIWPNSANFRPSLTKFGPDLAKSKPDWAYLRTNLLRG